MKNIGISALVFGGLAAATLGMAGHAAADTGIDASTILSNSSYASTSLVRNSFMASPTTYASPAATVVPWSSVVNSGGDDEQPWSSVSGADS